MKDSEKIVKAKTIKPAPANISIATPNNVGICVGCVSDKQELQPELNKQEK